MFNPLTENSGEPLDNQSDGVNVGCKSNDNSDVLKQHSQGPKNEELSPTLQRKRHFLSQAHKFAELKKLNASALPFNLHIHLENNTLLDSERPAMTTMCPNTGNVVQSDQDMAVCKDDSTETNTHTENGDVKTKGVNSTTTTTNVCDILKGHNCDRYPSSEKGGKGCSQDEDEGAFDVYNIETALPDMDWKSLEEKIRVASEQAKLIKEVGCLCFDEQLQ